MDRWRVDMTRRIYVTDEQLGHKCIELQRSDTFYVGGDSTIFVPSERCKYIDKSVCREWIDLNGETIFMTPSEAAKTEMRRSFDPHLSKGSSLFRKGDLPLLDLAAPIYWDGRSKKFKGYYIDINSAYYQIYRWLWLDTLWPRGTGSDLLDFCTMTGLRDLARWKPARNAVIGICRSTTLTTWKGAIVRDQPYKNYHLNPMLWHTVLKVLHDIARFAVSHGAVYVATDGYIFRSRKSFDKMIAMLVDFDLRHKTLIGQTEIKAFGCYRVADRKISRHFHRVEHSRKAKAINNVEPFDSLKTLKWFNVVRDWKGG